MNPWIEAIYGRSPVALQNLFVSAYGWHLHRLRYGGVHREFFRFLEESQWWSPERIRAYQDRELARLVEHAAQTVAYYRNQFRSLGIRPGDIRSRADLRRLPVLRREHIRGREEELLSDVADRSALIEGHTSGTTGTALIFFKSRSATQRNWAVIERLRRWAGVSCRHRRASFGLRMVVPDRASGPPYSRFSWAERQRLFSNYDIHRDNARQYYEELLRFRPDYLEGYPSAVSLVAGFMREQGLDGVRPRAVITYAETLLGPQRELLETQFRCPVFDWYGTSEPAVQAMQCERGSFHVASEYGIVEVVDGDGNPLPPGQEGEIAGTCFVNPEMPLLRYGTGDIGSLSDRLCPCGRGLETMAGIRGRQDDVIVTPDGRHIGRLDPVFKDTHRIRESQILQEHPDRVTVLVVPDSGYSDADTGHLLKNLRYYLGDALRFEIRLVERIDRTATGKLRAVVSRLSTRPRWTAHGKAPAAGPDDGRETEGNA